MRNFPPDGERIYAYAIGQIEALHTDPRLTASQVRIGTLVVLDAISEALAGSDGAPWT